MARAEPVRNERMCTKEYLMFATSGGAVGGLFEHTVATPAAQPPPFICSYTAGNSIGLVASLCRLIQSSGCSQHWSDDKGRPDITA